MPDLITKTLDAITQWPPEYAVLAMAIIAVILALWLSIILVHAAFKNHNKDS